MLTFMKIYSAEILSILMGFWLLWIIMVYANYFKEIRMSEASSCTDLSEDLNLKKARDKRKETYKMAVTFPSYAIFWVAVTIWGISFLLKRTIE